LGKCLVSKCERHRVVCRIQLEGLRGRRLHSVAFKNCYFRQTALENSSLVDCEIENSEFERLNLAYKPKELTVTLAACKVRYVTILQGDDHMDVYDPERILYYLVRTGFSVSTVEQPAKAVPASTEPDLKLELVQKVVATFRRSTQASEGVLKLRLGSNASEFFRTVLPELLKYKVLERVDNAGGGNYGHFKLGMKMGELASLFSNADNSYVHFLNLLKAKRANPVGT
jgi:hypothetical protein